MQELHNFGFNAQTVGFLGILIFAVVEACGFWQQSREIWKQKSGESVSVPTFIYLLAYFVSCIIYGIWRSSIAITFNGLICTVPLLLLCRGLKRYKGFTFFEYIMTAFLAGYLTAMLLLPWKDSGYLIISFGSIGAASFQAWELWSKKSVGVSKLSTFLILEASTVFWLIFAYSTDDWVLKIVCPMAFVILLITIGLWLRYRHLPVPALPQ